MSYEICQLTSSESYWRLGLLVGHRFLRCSSFGFFWFDFTFGYRRTTERNAQHDEGRGLMARGKIKPLAKKCKKCSATNETSKRRIRMGLCYECRKTMHDAIGINILKEANTRLKVALSIMSSLLLILVAYAVYYKHLTLPYGSRTRSTLLEFKGLEVAVPALALTMFSVAMLSFVAANYFHYFNEKTYKRIINTSLYAGVILYSVSIFFGNDIRDQ